VYKKWKNGNHPNRGDIMNKKKVLLIFFAVGFSIIIFFVSYNITLRYYNENNNDISREVEQSVNSNNANEVNENAQIILKTKTKDNKTLLDKSLTFEDLKKIIGKDKIEKSDLQNYYSKLNYSIESFNENTIVLLRETTNVLNPNKYYLGEKDGFIALFKTDDKGNPKIEDDKNDISTKKVTDLSDIDQNKIINFQKVYDTKEEAEEDLSQYTS
jgi:hypothetical protein